tara:strand:- start:7774 stop:8817 length:1044 start_codon:yes stop_codon:yes gene_type:complete
MKEKVKKIVVIGAGGYIGTTLVDLLLKENYFVIGIDRYFFGKELLGKDVLQNQRFSLLQKDIRNLGSDDFADCDVVINLAGLSNDPSCELDPNLTNDINYVGSVDAAKSAKKAGVAHYVFSSSCSVYGHGSNAALTEESELYPISEYAKAKVNAEKAILNLTDENYSVTVLRNSTVYGHSKRARFDLVINLMTLTAWQDKKVYIMGGGKQWRPIIHVSDVAKAFKAVIEADNKLVNKQIFNVGSTKHNYQVFQISNMIKKVIPETELITVPDDADKRSYNVSFDKIQSVLNFNPTITPLEGIKEIKEALDNGIINPKDVRTVTVKYYRYLLDAERIIREVGLNGKVF